MPTKPTLACLIDEHQDDILREWVQRARASHGPPPARGDEDAVARVLSDVAARLRRAVPPSELAAESHAAARPSNDAGRDPAHALRAGALLRSVIVDLARRSGIVVSWDEVEALHGALDSAALEAWERRASARSSRDLIFEKRFREIADHAPGAVFLKGSDGRYLFANRWAANLLGKRPEDVVGRTASEILPPQVVERVRAAEQQAAVAGEAVTEDVVPTPQGERVLITVRFPFEIRPGELGTVGLAFDVTERRRAEDAARHAAELLDLGDAFLEIDREWRVTRVNPHQERLAQKARSEMLGRIFWEIWPETATPGSAYWRELHRCMEERIPVQFEDHHAHLGVWMGVSAYPTSGGVAVFLRDVSAAKRTEQDLRAAHGRLRAHVSMTPLAVVEWDSEYRVAAFSPRAEELFGWSAEEVVGRRIDEIPWVPEGDRPSVRAVMRDMTLGTRPTNVNANRNVRKDGSIIYCEWYNSALSSPDGKLVSVLSLVLDVTERRAAEARAEFLARFPQENPDPIMRVSPDLVVVYANEAAKTLLQDVEPGEAAPQDIAGPAREAMSSGRRARVEARRGDVHLALHFVPVGSEVNVYGQDDTERKRAEEALLASEARARAISRNIRDAIVVLQAIRGQGGECTDWRYLEANDGALELLGRTREQVIGRSVREVLPERAAAVHERMARVLATGEPERYETSYGGRTSVVTLFRVDASSVGSAALDITDRKHAEDALRAANAQLVEADRRKDEFLGMLSHELRNPLAPIRNSTYILAHSDPLGEQATRARTVIQRQTEHLTRLVDDLLDVTRIARGKIELRRERADLAATVHRAAEDLRPLVSDRGLHLVVAAPEHAVWADVDPTRVAQIVGNLLSNAVKFTPPGGRVEVSMAVAGSSCEIRVADSGVGIEPEMLERVFEPFVQAERSLARTQGGLGLGLALVKGLVELHGGTVSASSGGPGAGATFIARLPLPHARSHAAGSNARDPAVSSTRRRVLIVDDNRDAAESLADLVRLFGHEVDLAFDGPSALAKALEWAPEVVLCDIGLPGMSGYEVARALRAGPAAGAQLIAISGYAQPEDLARAADAGFDGHLAKPPDPAHVERLLG
jgi:PAS domain S-box-containing protein